jgi:hypothetical protein
MTPATLRAITAAGEAAVDAALPQIRRLFEA